MSTTRRCNSTNGENRYPFVKRLHGPHSRSGVCKRENIFASTATRAMDHAGRSLLPVLTMLPPFFPDTIP